MLKLAKLSVLSLLIATMVGCVSVQPPVALQENFWEANPKTVGLYMAPIPEPNFYWEGNVGLLDMAIIEGAMSSLSSHMETFNEQEFAAVKDDIAGIVAGRGLQLKVIEEAIDSSKLPKFKDPDGKDEVYFSRRDFREIGKQHGISQLIVITPYRVGVARPYYGFVPTGAPRAVFELQAQIIDTTTNQLNWYATIAKHGFATGEWDEPPTFPGLTNVFYISLEQAREEIVQTLGQNGTSPALSAAAAK